LLIALFSHTLWINFNRTTVEEITYILSHHLVKFFVSVAQGQVLPVPISKNEKVLSEVKISTLFDDDEMVEDYRSDHLDNLFNF